MLFFENWPGVPAENRWLAFHPFESYTVLLIGVHKVASRGFLLGHGDCVEFPDDEPEDGLEEEQRHRVCNGKRVRGAKDMFKRPAKALAQGLICLICAEDLDRFQNLMVRDVGPMHFLDWRAREHAEGRNWFPGAQGGSASNVWDPTVEDRDDEFEPTLYWFYRNNLSVLRVLESGLAAKIVPDPGIGSDSDEEDEEAAHIIVPPTEVNDLEFLLDICKEVPESELVQTYRSWGIVRLPWLTGSINYIP